MQGCKKILIIEDYKGKRSIFRGSDAVKEIPKCTTAMALNAMLAGIPVVLDNGNRMWIECEKHGSDFRCNYF